MVLVYGTLEGIDLQVSTGCSVGYFGMEDDLSKIPRMIGDWCIKKVFDHYKPNVGYLVATPTNRRTRLIYNQGRLEWLKVMGFNPEQAELYRAASKRNPLKWDHHVATYVCHNYDLDSFIIEEIMSSRRPARASTANGVFTRLTDGQITAACGILLDIRNIISTRG